MKVGKQIWNAFLCQRCDRPFLVQGFRQVCAACWSAGARDIQGGVSGT